MVNSHGDATVITDSFCRLSLLTAIAWNNPALPQQLPATGAQPEPRMDSCVEPALVVRLEDHNKGRYAHYPGNVESVPVAKRVGFVVLLDMGFDVLRDSGPECLAN
jgi:hypothetical protein